jgi:transposase InsO family protein
MSVSGLASWSTWTSRSWAASLMVVATASTAGPRGFRGRGIGYDYVHSAVDDRSRVAFSQILNDETGTTAARFLVEAAGFFADHGVVIQRVLTDNAKAYAESVVFAETAAGLGIRLKRIRPYRPQTNGKVERFNRTLLEEWAYGRLYRSTTERRRALARWLRFYNRRRPHTALDGLTPMAALVNNAHGNHRAAAWSAPATARR